MAVITARKAVRDKIVAIVTNMTAVADTKKTTMSRLRSSAQDYEGFIFRARYRSSANSLISSDWRQVSEQWLLELYSPRTGLGNEALKEDQMLDYSDSILETFMEKPTLEDLSTVSLAFIVSDTVIWQSDTGLDDTPRSKWSFNIQVDRQEPC